MIISSHCITQYSKISYWELFQIIPKTYNLIKVELCHSYQGLLLSIVCYTIVISEFRNLCFSNKYSRLSPFNVYYQSWSESSYQYWNIIGNTKCTNMWIYKYSMYEIFKFCLSYGLEFVISSRNEIMAFVLEHLKLGCQLMMHIRSRCHWRYVLVFLLNIVLVSFSIIRLLSKLGHDPWWLISYVWRSGSDRE